MVASAVPGSAVGVYANAGRADDQIGWQSSNEPGAEAYAKLARQWIDAGATLIGGCCGTDHRHIEAICDSVVLPASEAA